MTSSLNACKRRLDRALEELQGHVPGEAVADDHVGRLAQEVAPLDVADEVEAGVLGQLGVGLADELVPFLGLLADGEEGDGRVRQAGDVLREDRAHVRELDEMLRARVGVRAGVDQDRGAAERRDGNGDRRPVDVRQAADLQEPGREHGTGVPGSDDRVGFALVHRAAGEEERALALLADGVRGLLVHGHDLLGVDDLEAAGERLEHVPRAEEDGGHVGGSGGACARDDLLRRPIAAHGVDGDPNGRHPVTELGSGRPERLDLATAIGAAGRADVMRPLRLVALRALDERGNRRLVRRPALVSARLGGLSLRDGHRGG